MGKYDPLARFLIAQAAQSVPMSFAEVEAVLGFKLPRSKQYPAWWSNNPSNNPMTKVWLGAGFATEHVDTTSERLVFRRQAGSPSSGGSGAGVGRSGPYPGFGALRGTVRAARGVDLASPADETWGQVFE